MSSGPCLHLTLCLSPLLATPFTSSYGISLFVLCCLLTTWKCVLLADLLNGLLWAGWNGLPPTAGNWLVLRGVHACHLQDLYCELSTSDWVQQVKSSYVCDALLIYLIGLFKRINQWLPSYHQVHQEDVERDCTYKREKGWVTGFTNSANGLLLPQAHVPRRTLTYKAHCVNSKCCHCHTVHIVL